MVKNYSTGTDVEFSDNIKLDSVKIIGDLSGNATTVTNGVYTTKIV